MLTIQDLLCLVERYQNFAHCRTQPESGKQTPRSACSRRITHKWHFEQWALEVTAGVSFTKKSSNANYKAERRPLHSHYDVLLIPEIEKCHMPSHYHPHAFFNMPTTTRPGLVLWFLIPNQLTTTPKNLTNFANPKSIGNSPKNSANFFLKVLHHPTETKRWFCHDIMQKVRIQKVALKKFKS